MIVKNLAKTVRELGYWKFENNFCPFLFACYWPKKILVGALIVFTPANRLLVQELFMASPD